MKKKIIKIKRCTFNKIAKIISNIDCDIYNEEILDLTLRDFITYKTLITLLFYSIIKKDYKYIKKLINDYCESNAWQALPNDVKKELLTWSHGKNYES